ncbi:hypothetical protein ACFL5W_00885 [Thermodesulfobacteriota bacterium]
MALKTNNKIYTYAIALAILFACLFNMPAEGLSQRIIGVTEGSVYNDFVRIYWFDAGASATLSKDSGIPVVYEEGSKIEANGEYEIVLTLSEIEENRIKFTIDTEIQTATINTNINRAGTILKIKLNPGSYFQNRTPVIAIWSEDLSGNFSQNLFVSTTPATNYMRYTGNYVNRPQALPVWMHKACIARLYGNETLYLAVPQEPIPSDLDAVSGATQKNGFEVLTSAISPSTEDQIVIYCEINQPFDFGWYFYGDNADHEEDGLGKFSDDPYFFDSAEPAVIYSVVVDLDQAGIYEFDTSPAGYSHYAGRTGAKYTDFHADNTVSERYKFDHAQKMLSSLSVEVMHISGDISGDNTITLLDALLALQICSTGTSIPMSIESGSDVNGDIKIGLEEVLYIVQKVAGVR